MTSERKESERIVPPIVVCPACGGRAVPFIRIPGTFECGGCGALLGPVRSYNVARAALEGAR